MASDRERQLDLLQIVCCVAWVDGDVSAEEKRLLEQLVARYFSSENGADASEEAARLLEAWTVDGTLLDELMARLTVAEDRLLALKLAYMMARVSQRPKDSAAINPQEKVLYRQLVEGLRLTEAEIQEAEWAAEQELSSGKGIWALLGAAFSGLGAWPSHEMLETPGMQWL
ncbi:TerB family tellurite resistance protein [Cyanobium sp. Alchichica 3B3-8F6]|uniref:tellurite resistance TerB family protein n=1 Tax=Synechococcales TaxID=1890424 RepID=UPI000B996518|nr:MULTISPECIES: TerB family tellurite resistance protein [Synechococcales]MCP9880893.1 TerB family tellurite resistance protein [Cyanobium sp. Alchichica 3B3-8F6]